MRPQPRPGLAHRVRPQSLTPHQARAWWFEYLAGMKAWAEGRAAVPPQPRAAAARRPVFPAIGALAAKTYAAWTLMEDAAALPADGPRRAALMKLIAAGADAMDELLRADGHDLAAAARRRMGEEG